MLARRIARSAQYRLNRLLHGPESSVPQLEMVWPERAPLPPAPTVPDGFVLRTYAPGDERAYAALLERAGLGVCPLDYWFQHLLPDGFFVIASPVGQRLAAACFASHQPAPRHPYGGNLGWLAADPDFAGRGLGQAATAAVVRRLMGAGYTRIYLTTDDPRLAAIKVYLRMGWQPVLFEPGMLERWRRITEQLSMPFTPADWPTV